MHFSNPENRYKRLGQVALLIAAVCGSTIPARAVSFSTPVVFATGGAVNSTGPDSVTYGNGSVWVEYGNGAKSDGSAGSSIIVQYNTAGSVQNTYTVTGLVDGLKYNPNTGMVWALQNQDGSSQLSIINPSTKAINSFSYGAPYPAVSGSRGFDDAAFIGNNIYLSETNPASTADAVIVKLNGSTPATPIGFSTVLTGAGLTVTDSDSLKSTPSGGLILTGEADGTLTFITNPGLASQSANSVKLSGAGGATIGNPDDSIYATATSGVFYLADTSANTVYAISATGLTPNSSLFVNVGNEFGSVDPTTGIVTQIMTGTGLHGLEFVPSAAVPEPSTLGISLAGLGIASLAILRKRLTK